MSEKSKSMEWMTEGPKTRSRIKVPQPKNKDIILDGTPEVLTKKKKKNKKRKNVDETSSNSGDSGEDYQYIIDGDSTAKKTRVRYFDEFGVEEEIKEMKDITFKKDAHAVVKAGHKAKQYRTRNVDMCVTCDEPGEGLLSCVRCPASFHPSCISGCLPNKRAPPEPWFCRRCRYESNVLHRQRRIPKILPFDEEQRYKYAVEDLMKREKDDLSFEKALDVVSSLMNPRTFFLPRDLSDHLIDMPYMEHIPKKQPCCFDAVCYACKKNPSDELPAIECDYCPASWHLHCLEVPMTTVLNEFWMCPLHGEIAIDRFVLDTAGITKRMFYWNRCRTKVKPKKVIKHLMNKLKEVSPALQSPLDVVGNVPFVVDKNNVKLKQDETVLEGEDCLAQLGEPIITPFTTEDTLTIMLQAADYLEKKPQAQKLLKDYYIDREKFLSEFVFSIISMVDFSNLSPVELDYFPTEEDFDFEECYYHEKKPEAILKSRGSYSVEDIKSSKIIADSAGQETLNFDSSFHPVNKLYYPGNETESDEDSSDDQCDEKTVEDLALDEINRFFPFLVSDSKDETNVQPMEIILPTAGSSRMDSAPITCHPTVSERLSVHQFGNLYDGQLAFPIKVYYFVRYYATYYTDAEKIIVLYQKAGSSHQEELPKYIPKQILSCAPDRFTEEYLFDELQRETNALSPAESSIKEHSQTIQKQDSATMKLISRLCKKLKKTGVKKKVKKRAIQVLKKAGFGFLTKSSEDSAFQLQSPFPQMPDKKAENDLKKLILKSIKNWNQTKKKRKLSPRPIKHGKRRKRSVAKSMDVAADLLIEPALDQTEHAQASSERTVEMIPEPAVEQTFEYKAPEDVPVNVIDATSTPPIVESADLVETRMEETIAENLPTRDSDKLARGLENELVESDESRQDSDNVLETSKDEEVPDKQSTRKRRWTSISSTDDVKPENIDLSLLDIDSFIPEKQSEIDEVDKDTKDYLVETPEFRRYLRKANAELAGIRKLVLQLKKFLGLEEIDEAPVPKKAAKRKKVNVTHRKAPPKPSKGSNLESLTPNELLGQILAGRRNYEQLVREHREEGQARKKSAKQTDTKSSFFDSLDGIRQTKARLTCLNENAIAKAAFRIPPPEKKGGSSSTERLAKKPVVTRLISCQDPQKSAKASQLPPSAFKSRSQKASKPKSVSINESATVTHEIEKWVKTKTCKARRNSELSIIISSKDNKGKRSWYRMRLPGGPKQLPKSMRKDFDYQLLEHAFYLANKKPVKKVAIKTPEKAKTEKKKKERVKESKVKEKKQMPKKATEKAVQPKFVVEKKNPDKQQLDNVEPEKVAKPKKKKKKRGPPLMTEKRLAKIKLNEMLPPKLLTAAKFDFSKMLKLDCRKIGDFLYLMCLKNGKWTVISRIAVHSELLAFDTSTDILAEIATSEYLEKTPGELDAVDYDDLIGEVQRYEKLCSVGIPSWNKNAGLRGTSLRDGVVNMDAEYALDKKFLRPDLPVIGALAMMKPVHSFAAIPVHFPLTTFGTADRCVVQLQLLAPRCLNLGPEHATIFYDKMSLKVYLQASRNFETIVDDKVYGGNIYSKNPDKCICCRRTERPEFKGDRPMRAVVSDNSRIQMGCLDFIVMLMPLEQIWTEIPGSCPNLVPADLGRPTPLNINDYPEMSDEEVS